MTGAKTRRGSPRRRLEGRVRDLLPGGDAVVETDEGVLFAAGALPGERVVIDGARRAGKILRGRVAEVLDPSPDRVAPACTHLARCGGCPLMSLADPAQGRQLARFLADALAGIPGAEDLEVPVHRPGPRLGYRRRARMAFRAGPDGRALGYHARRSRSVVSIDGCPVLSPTLDGCLPALRERLLPHLGGAGEIHLALGIGGLPVVVIRTPSPQPPEAYRAARALVVDGTLAGLALGVGEPATVATWGDPRAEGSTLGGLVLRGAGGGFAQANAEVNRALVERAIDLARPDGHDVIELYAGHGNLTIPLAARARRVVAVEQDAEAAAACRENLRTHGLDARIEARDVARLGTAGDGRFEVLVLDPPRAGAKEAVPWILERAPRRVVYVSCEPRSLARDLRLLADGGYRVDAAEAFDMFPHTGHVESVVRLVRA